MKTTLLLLFAFTSTTAIAQMASADVPVLNNNSTQEIETNDRRVDVATLNVMAEGCTCIIKWMTLAEGNRSLFMVEKSVDGKPFQKIATTHTSGDPSEYIMFDEYFYKDARYRLISLNMDNQIEFEEILTVESPCPARLGVSK